jgi:hypothetical protein
LSGDLKKHKRIHTKERPFICRFVDCTASFAQSSTRNAHERIHNRERPYACGFDGCDAAFAQSGALEVHKRTHTGEKPFRCNFRECDAAFAQSGVLERHKLVHTGARPYVCDIDDCGASFAQSSVLERHKASVHSKEGIQRRKLQEQAMQNALVFGGYVQSFERGVVPPPGQFTREVYFDYRCALADNFMPGERKYAYVDFVVMSPDGRLVFLEVDEEQHGYNSQLCETTRMWNICEAIAVAELGGDINVFWLRVNPNSGFHVGDRTLRTPREQRFSEVIRFIDNLKSSPDDEYMQVGYAFYDCEPNGRPLVLKDPDYHPDVLPGVVCISKGSQKLIQPQKFEPVNPLFAPAGPSDLTAAAFRDEPEPPDSDSE